jgi:head-tail adaptor
MSLTAAELAAMRADAKATVFPDSITVQRKTDTKTARGGRTTTWANLVTVKGLVAPPDDDHVTEGKRSEFRTILLEGATDVRTGDRLVVGAATYEVSDVIGGHTWEVARRVLAVVV